MKKIFAIVMVLALAFSLCLTVNAATGINDYEKEVLNTLKSKEVVGEKGWKYTLPAEYITAAENHFNKIDMTEDQKDKILGYIDDGIEVIKEEGDKMDIKGNSLDLAKMGSAAKQSVLDLGKKACQEVNLTLSYDPTENTVIIKDAGGATVFENSPVIKTTGEDFAVSSVAVVAIVAAVVIGGAAAMFVVANKKGLLAK